MITKLFEELSALDQVEAIALGGSRAGENYDENSDYDVYLYLTAPIAEETRRAILQKYCSYLEIGNRFWEEEDNCRLKNGVDLDVLYRSIDDLSESISRVVEQYEAHNGYTTCLWHNLLTCKSVCDKNGRLRALKERFSVPYPEQLRKNILERNLKLLYAAMPAYSLQIKKACGRNDRVSVVHRTAAFLESYFDVLFALNRRTHPGEKRLVELCRKTCEVLPENFEANLNRLFDDMAAAPQALGSDLDAILQELKKVV